jgi:cell division protein FtsQ
VSPPRASTTADIDPRIAQRRDEVESGRARRRWRWAIVAATAVAVAAVVGVLLHTPLFGARVVRVEGAHPQTTTAAIVAAAGLSGRPPLISVDPATTAARVERLPFIASATVARRWPDAVTISVTERVPTVTMAGPAASWSTLDGGGRTVAVGPSRPPALPVLVVHGVRGPVPPAPVGRVVGPAAEPGLAVARTLPPAFAGQVVSITVAPDGTVSLALHVGLTVLLGTTSDLRAKYEDVAAIIAHHTLPGAKVIDVTVPQSPVVGP